MIILRTLTIGTLLSLFVAPLTVQAFPMRGFKKPELRAIIARIQEVRKCKTEAGEVLQLCLAELTEAEILPEQESLDDAIVRCEDEYQQAVQRCDEQGMPLRSVLNER